MLLVGLAWTWGGRGGANDPVEARAADAEVATASGASSTAVLAQADTDTVLAPAGCEVDESTTRDITRVSGADRFATAACASATGYPQGATTVVLARGDTAGNYADALAGTVLAHHVQGPVLLTSPDDLPAVTADEIERLGAERVILLGGEGAISPDVEGEVAALGVTTERISGRDRAATAALISTFAGATDEAFVVNGYRPADALVAGTVAARAGAALLLVNGDGIPDQTAGWLQDVEKATIIGGYGVVSSDIEDAIRGQVTNVTRLSGPSRDETAASVARALPSEGTVHAVSGADPNLVDAIAAGWLAAQPGGGPVLYHQLDTPGRGTDRYLRLGGLDGTPAIRLVGGEGIMSDALVDQLEIRLDEAEAGGPAPQTRAMWVHLFDGSLKSREAMARTLDTAASHNLNTVIAQVGRRHDSYSTSDVLPRTTDPAVAPDFDLLAELVPAAKARGLEVHAWFAIAPAYHGAYDEPGLPAGHIYLEHGPKAPESERWMTRAQDGTWSSTYMDVGVPAFRDHVVAMFEEVAQRYDVDAVHLDYPRYPEGGQWGYNPIARAQWQAEGSPDFSNWRRAQTEKLAKAIKQAVTAARPGTRVTMAAIAQGDGPAGVGGFHNTRAYAQVYQDWAGWLARDVVDAAYPMAYMREDGVSSSCPGFSSCRHADWYDNWVAFAEELAPNEDIAIGQGAFLNTVGQSLAQVSEALTSTDGLVVYSYQQDTRCPTSSSCSPVEPQGSLLRALLDGHFADPAPAR